MEKEIQSYREIDIKETIVYSLRRWRIAVLYALIIAFLATGLLAYNTTRLKVEKTKLNQKHEEALNMKRVIEKEIKSVQSIIDDTMAELEQSIYANLDYSNVYSGSILFSIELENEDKYLRQNGVEEKTSNLSRLQNSYKKLFDGGAFYTYVKGKTGLDVDIKYFNQLMSVSDVANGVFSFNILADTEEKANEYLRLADEFMHSEGIYDFNKVAKHKVNVLYKNGRFQIIDDVRTKRIALNNMLVENTNLLIDKENDLIKNAKDIENLEGKLKGGEAIKPYIKRFILGGILGLVLSFIAICAKFVFANFVDTEYNVKQGLNLDTIARLGYKKKRFFVDKIIDAFAGENNYIRDEKEFVSYCAIKLESLCCNEKNIAFIGSVDSKLLGDFANKVNEGSDKLNIISCGTVSKNAEAYSKMLGCDGVVIVEKRNESKFSELELELNSIKPCNKKIIGIIML